jgi:hypothetical protein
MATNANSRLQPTVLHPIELASYIQYLLANHASPTTLVVCASQEAFLTQLQGSIAHAKDLERAEAEDAEVPPEKLSMIAARAHELLIPTIYQLSSARTIKVTFCATLAQLQAYLGVYGTKETTDAPVFQEDNVSNAVPTLALLNPLAIHKETSSFSAQGLSRTFASAVEAAIRLKQKLVIIECPSRVTGTPANADEDEDSVHDGGGLSRLNDGVDPWDQQVPVLNVTTKSFGAGERGWVGRTVLARRIVGRWCVFEMVN